MPAPAARTVLSFDYGLRRIGVAVGNTLTGTAEALATIAANDGTARLGARSTVASRTGGPAAIVAGVPYNMAGRDASLTTAALRFADELGGRYGIEVHRVDERLTSREAEDELRERRRSGAKTQSRPARRCRSRGGAPAAAAMAAGPAGTAPTMSSAFSQLDAHGRLRHLITLDGLGARPARRTAGSCGTFSSGGRRRTATRHRPRRLDGREPDSRNPRHARAPPSNSLPFASAQIRSTSTWHCRRARRARRCSTRSGRWSRCRSTYS